MRWLITFTCISAGLTPLKSEINNYGVVVSISFDLYGCVQAIVHPGLNNDGAIQDTRWFDVARLEITSKEPVMDVPNFEHGEVAEGKKGPSEKPMAMKS